MQFVFKHQLSAENKANVRMSPSCLNFVSFAVSDSLINDLAKTLFVYWKSMTQQEYPNNRVWNTPPPPKKKGGSHLSKFRLLFQRSHLPKSRLLFQTVCVYCGPTLQLGMLLIKWAFCKFYFFIYRYCLMRVALLVIVTNLPRGAHLLFRVHQIKHYC